jgi:hypothetical protein
MKKLQPALYHYTSHNAWELVQKEGRLLYGDVPLSPHDGHARRMAHDGP